MPNDSFEHDTELTLIPIETYYKLHIFRRQIFDWISREKGQDLTQSYDKTPYTHRKVKKASWQHKDVF